MLDSSGTFVTNLFLQDMITSRLLTHICSCASAQVIAKGQLRGKGIGAFVVSRGSTTFYQGTASEIRAQTSRSRGSTLYVMADPAANSSSRMMKCITEQGMPSPANPMIVGNLFLILDIEFPGPGSITPEAQASLKQLLPGPAAAPPVETDHEVRLKPILAEEHDSQLQYGIVTASLDFLGARVGGKRPCSLFQGD